MGFKKRYLVPFVGFQWAIKDSADMVVVYLSVMSSLALPLFALGVVLPVTVLTRIWG